MTYATVIRHLGLSRKTTVGNLLTFRKNRTVLITASWASLAVGVAALGVFVGRELRIRYKFNHRNPSDFFAHAGSEEIAADYGMGI
jgi:hypothetical protein